jgi:hypothetical protein
VTEGLLFVSEADFPLHVVYWRRPGGPLTAERVAARLPRPPAHLDAGAEVHDGARGHLLEEDTVDGFFSVATTPRPWHTDRDRADVRRYQELVRTLKARLHDLHVFRFGASTIRAYIMGVTPDGDWAGVSTILIET